MYFDDESRDWDNDYRVTRAVKIGEEIETYIKDKKSLKAMEFGCGTGLISERLEDKFQEILMVDSSQGMINNLIKKIANKKILNMKPWCGDILNYEGEKLDFIYTSMVFHHILDLKPIISKLYSLLKKDGRLIVVDLCPDDGNFHEEVPDFNGYNGFEEGFLEQLFIDAGFTNVTSRVFFEGTKETSKGPHPYKLFSLSGDKI